MKTTFSFSLLPFHLNFRRELRFALLAAMETCWVYCIGAFLASLMGVTRALSPLALFAAYWIALVVGRVLPRRRERWVVLQAITVGIAVITLIAVARIELYPRVGLFDSSWLPRYVLILLAFPSGITAEHLAALGVLFVFMRGLGFGQRPMTLWFTGFQFRLGIVIFFVLFLFTGFLKPFDPSPWLFVYFFLSLLAIALARIDEMESDVRFGPRWAVTLLASVALVLFLGLILLQFLTLESATSFLLLFAPLWIIVAAVVTLVAIPFAFLAGWLIDFLRPLFASVNQVLQRIQNLMPPAAAENLRQAQGSPQFELMVSILKTLFLLVVVLTIGYLLANALNRRMKRIEDDVYIRERLGEDERRANRAGLSEKKAPPRRRAGSIAAESIRRIYAALVARASEAGLPRAIAETPYEYLPRLERAWPDQSADLNAITDAYVDVHYGEREFGAAEVNRLRELWRRVEATIKREAYRGGRNETTHS